MSGTAQLEQTGGEAGGEAAVDPGVESRARNMGWMPRGAWRGEPERWVDAPTYVERGERMLPLLQERNRALDKTVSDLKVSDRENKQMLADLVQRTRKAEKLGYDRAMRELQGKRAEAVAAGDADAFNRAEAEIKDLGPAPEVVPPPPVQQANGVAEPNPVVTAWVRRNRWFNTDPIANAAAVSALSQVEREFPGDTLEEHLIEVEHRIAQRWPEHFARRAPANGAGEEEQQPASRQRAPAVMASGSVAERRPSARSFEAMPADVRAQFERQKKMMAGKGAPLTKDEFATYYWESEE